MMLSPLLVVEHALHRQIFRRIGCRRWHRDHCDGMISIRSTAASSTTSRCTSPASTTRRGGYSNHNTRELAATTLALALGLSMASLSPHDTTMTTTRLAGNEDNNQNQDNASFSSVLGPKSLLFVWDFDWTIVNCNSDEYVPAQFFPDEHTLSTEFSKLYRQYDKDWHKAVQGVCATAIQEYGATPDGLLAAARRMPFLTAVRQTLDLIHTNHDNDDEPMRINQMILSDGNTLFIQEFLHANGMTKHFNAGLISNIGTWVDDDDDDGDNDNKHRFLSVVHQSAQYGGHDCPTCPANLCKTQALRHALAKLCPTDNNSHRNQQQRPFRIVYVGDGANDACPALHVLSANDVLLARVGKKRKSSNIHQGAETDNEASLQGQEQGGLFGIRAALDRAQAKDGGGPQCTVLEWHAGQELKSLVENILAEEKK